MSDRFRNPEKKVNANPCCLCVRPAATASERLVEKKMLPSFTAQKKWLL